MRRRKLLTGLLLALVSLVAMAGAASAAPAQDKPKIKEAEQHCIDLLEQGKTIDDCQKAPSPIKPADERAHLGDHLLRRAVRRFSTSSPGRA